VGTRKKKGEGWERNQKLIIFSNITIMRCCARDSLSFVHFCDVWSNKQKIL